MPKMHLSPAAGERARGVKAIVIAIALWTAVAFCIVFFDPGHSQSMVMPCLRLVGRSPECEASQAAINQAWQILHVWPLLIAVASGYVAILVVAARGARRRRRLAKLAFGPSDLRSG